MRIKGHFWKFGAAYVEAIFICKEIGIDKPLKLLVDTGASRTTISDNDAIKLGIDYKKLERLGEGVIGIGGMVDTYSIKNVKLVFGADDGKIHTEDMNEVVVIKHEIEDEKTKERLKWLPSLLGRDVLDKFALLVDKRSGEVLITDEKIQMEKN